MKQYRYIGESDEMTTNGKVYDINANGTFIDDTGDVCHLGSDYEKYFEFLGEDKLSELLQQRNDYKAIEKENESYVITNDFEMQEKYFIAKKLRKKTEKAIFKILEDDINR